MDLETRIERLERKVRWSKAGWLFCALLLLTGAATVFKNDLVVGTLFSTNNAAALGNGNTGLVTVTATSGFGVGGCAPYSYGDMCVSRGGGATGVVYFGNTIAPYLYYDGTNFIFNNGKVISGGQNTATCSQGGATCTPNLGTCCTVTVPSGVSSCWCGNQSAFNPGTCLISGTTASCYSSAGGGSTMRVGWF